LTVFQKREALVKKQKQQLGQKRWALRYSDGVVHVLGSHTSRYTARAIAQDAAPSGTRVVRVLVTVVGR
jgi:hypothetical protein